MMLGTTNIKVQKRLSYLKQAISDSFRIVSHLLITIILPFEAVYEFLSLSQQSE